MEDLLIKASQSSSNDIQLEIENKTEFDVENHIVNDNMEHDDMAKNGNQDSDIVSGIDSTVDANESQNELEVNDVQDELMEGKGEKESQAVAEAEAEAEKRGEEGEVKEEFNAEGEQNENDENDSKDDDEEDDDESDDDDDNESDDDSEIDNNTDIEGKKTLEPFTTEEDVSCRRIVTALKVRGNSFIIFHFCSFSAILCPLSGIVLRGSFRVESPFYRSYIIYVC
jgi:hypothetical protein